MDIKEYTGRLTEFMSAEVDNRRAIEYIKDARLLLGAIKKRIQREGKDSNGRKMKGYSTKEAYFSKSQFVKKGAFKGQGKKGFKGERIVESQKIKFSKKSNSFIAGEVNRKILKQTPKSMYLKNGYKEFRDIQGRQTEFRDVTLSGDMMNDYVQSVDDKDVLLGFTNTLQSKKRKGQEKQNGSPIFTATNQELSDFATNVQVSENKIINSLLKS